MEKELPLSIVQYKRSIAPCDRAMAYLCLDTQNVIIDSGGDLAQVGIAWVEAGISLDGQIPVLEHLLPVDEEPIYIPNVQQSEGVLFDLHLFADSLGQWVLMFDNTEAATKLQLEQQERLNNDLNDEKKTKRRMQGNC